MKVGDKVKHKTRKRVKGIVYAFCKYDCVLVNLSDETGVMFKKFKFCNLEVFIEPN